MSLAVCFHKGYYERAVSLVETSEALTAATAEADRENVLPQFRGLSGVHTPKRVKWRAALAAYRSGHDYTDVVRCTQITQLELLSLLHCRQIGIGMLRLRSVCLEHLNDLDEAVKVVKATRSLKGARLVARHYMRAQDSQPPSSSSSCRAAKTRPSGSRSSTTRCRSMRMSSVCAPKKHAHVSNSYRTRFTLT